VLEHDYIGFSWSPREEYDVAIIGAGALGLITGALSVKNGFKTVIIEESPTLASGPSTKNEGWLHAGTYHANSIANESEALAVARRCLEGYTWVLNNYPHVVERGEEDAFA